MKLKYYLRGVGIGVVITTLVLTIAFNIRQQEPHDNNQPQSQTSNLDNILNSTAAAGSSEEKTTDSSTEAKQEVSSQPSSEALTEPSSEASTASAEVTTAAPTQAAEQINIVVNLSGLTSSEQVCDLLVAMGLISDANDFNNYLMASGYSDRIYPQTYTITKGSNYETIAKIICGL